MSFSTPSNVNLEKVEPLNQKRTLAFLNHWTTTTVSFLNQFSSVCESKLADVDNRLQRTEDALCILEAKLSSIPGLEDVRTSQPALDAAAPSQPLVTASPPALECSPSNAAAGGAAAAVGSTVEAQDAVVAPGTEAKEANPEQAAAVAARPPISKDARYSTYFKMVSLGVPEQAVKIKMSSEGLNPALLDDPLAPAPDSPPSHSGGQASDTEEELSSWSDD